jgi:hypothetical protein
MLFHRLEGHAMELIQDADPLVDAVDLELAKKVRLF